MTNSTGPFWINLQLTPEKRAMVKQLLVKNQRTFARHRLDIEINNQFKIKLTPKHEEHVYVENLPTPMKIREESWLNSFSSENAV